MLNVMAGRIYFLHRGLRTMENLGEGCKKGFGKSRGRGKKKKKSRGWGD
jgi:hypothetical protein